MPSRMLHPAPGGSTRQQTPTRPAASATLEQEAGAATPPGGGGDASPRAPGSRRGRPTRGPAQRAAARAPACRAAGASGSRLHRRPLHGRWLRGCASRALGLRVEGRGCGRVGTGGAWWQEGRAQPAAGMAAGPEQQHARGAACGLGLVKAAAG